MVGGCRGYLVGGCRGYVVGGCRGNVVGGCRGYGVAGLTENKTKPSSWGLAELGNNMSGIRGFWLFISTRLFHFCSLGHFQG